MCARPSTKEDSIIKSVYQQLSRYCFFLTQNKWDGEELIQETIHKALVKYGVSHTWKPALLKKIAYHTWIDKQRKRKEETESSMENREAPDSQYAEITALVERLLDFMTTKQLVVFLMKDVFRYQIAEIAEHCRMSETAVKAMLNRARRQARRVQQEPESIVDTRFYQDSVETIIPILVHVVRVNDPSWLIKRIPELFSKDSVSFCMHHTPSSYALAMTA
ncbi:sigma factor-like helix-turn-helix DNA-binding protein [Gracilibacillus timonensis]|uniref:sigma factor-like helix-turn-helix DNA-binding protein n=1 Tax=Gracilibacillus timonensis TaxID=1816696 RepID=UPI000825FAD0|nr:sigma factor-like helix-turn-helix DNA-binding protein [Gracilibacillus timonensis]